jgi:hypothetical protein
MSSSARPWSEESEQGLRGLEAEWGDVHVPCPAVAAEEGAERVLHALEAEWNALQSACAAEVAAWANTLDRMTVEQDSLRTAGRWMRGRDDFLGVLGLHRHEVWHSRMLAWLLDPCGHHGLGSRVLSALLQRAFGGDTARAESARLALAEPTCEEARDGGRLDIIVRAPGLTLIIENKVDAVEAPGQCDAYFGSFGQEPGAQFIFLTPTGRPPGSASGLAAEAFASVSYRDIRLVVRAAMRTAQPDARGRGIVEDYLRTLDREFP